ncbi:MAG: tRNA guanosine(15) transglycosylase TgtA [Ignisphaera sp.]
MDCFEVKDVDLAARIGKIKTKRGVIETPYIFPVVDPTLKNQFVSLNDIRRIGFNAIITNAYLLKKRLQKVEDIHSVLNFDGVVMTDSGAYQLLRYGNIDITNVEIVNYQCEIGSDIGVILDVPTPYDAPYEKALESAEITFQRAIEVQDIIEKCTNTLWTLPIQGGTHLEILQKYAIKSDSIVGYGYSLFALGSPTTLLENYMFDKVIEMIVTVRLNIRPSYPLHLFGAGHPLIMPFAIALGVDIMDSASYILYAKDGRYMTRKGTYAVKELSYFPCSCPVCSKYTVEEFNKLPKQDKWKLLALHNLYTLFRELNEIKECIKEGRLWEYLEEKARSHPAAKRAFETIKKNLEYIYRRTPREKPKGKALFILSEDSIYNPKLMLARRDILSRISRIPTKKKCIIFAPLTTKSSPKGLYKATTKECHLYFYYPILGLIPYTLINSYPFSQFEAYNEFSYSVIKDLAYTFIEYIMNLYKNLTHIVEVTLYIQNNVEWQYRFAETVKEYLQILNQKGIGIKIKILNLGNNPTY